MRRVNWTITEQQHRELKRLSKETGMPISELVRRALDHYFGALTSQHEPGPATQSEQVSSPTEESEVLP